MQIYFLLDAKLSAVPFAAFKFEESVLIEKALIAQAPSLLSLEYAEKLWQDIWHNIDHSLKVRLWRNLSFTVRLFFCFDF